MSESKVWFAVLLVVSFGVLVIAFAYGGLDGAKVWLREHIFDSPQLACQAVMVEEPASGMFALFFALIGGAASMTIVRRPENHGRILWSKVFAWIFVGLVFVMAGATNAVAKLSASSSASDAVGTTITIMYVVAVSSLVFALWFRMSANTGRG